MHNWTLDNSCLAVTLWYINFLYFSPQTNEIKKKKNLPFAQEASRKRNAFVTFNWKST